MNYRAIVRLAALGAVFAGNIWAGCGAAAGGRAGLVLPLHSGPIRTSTPHLDQGNLSIVGLWDVEFSSQGVLFDEGYDQFHSDNTEMMNDIPNPALGNVCLGVFVQTGPQAYLLHHVYWNFDNTGALIGRGVWLQTITIDKSGSNYAGTWNMKNYDLDGNLITAGPLAPVSGTLAATRITAD